MGESVSHFVCLFDCSLVAGISRARIEKNSSRISFAIIIVVVLALTGRTMKGFAGLKAAAEVKRRARVVRNIMVG